MKGGGVKKEEGLEKEGGRGRGGGGEGEGRGGGGRGGEEEGEEGEGDGERGLEYLQVATSVGTFLDSESPDDKDF